MTAVLRLRLIYGLSLAAILVGLMAADACLSVLNPADWPVPGLGVVVTGWLYRGALSTLVVSVFVWLTARELVSLARARGYQPSRLLAQIGAVSLVLGPYVACNAGGTDEFPVESWGLPLVTLALGLAFVGQAWRHGTQAVLVNVATTIFIICYVGGLASFVSRLRMESGGPSGIVLLLFSLFVIKMTDVGAYFVGRAVGRHKLIAWLSPKKTWEGFAGGLLVAILCAVGVGYWLRASGWVHGPLVSPAGLAAFGLVMGLLSVAGDLCASMLKRDAAVKDSGNALPGLGGVLDVMDSPLLAAPATWFLWTRLAS